MRETGFDMWLVINREYVEDPVYLSLVPAPVFHARRLSMLVFFDRGESQPLEILTVSRYPMDGYAAAWKAGPKRANGRGWPRSSPSESQSASASTPAASGRSATASPAGCAMA